MIYYIKNKHYLKTISYSLHIFINIHMQSVYKVCCPPYISQIMAQNYEKSQNMCWIISRGYSFEKIGKDIRGIPWGYILSNFLKRVAPRNDSTHILWPQLKKILNGAYCGIPFKKAEKKEITLNNPSNITNVENFWSDITKLNNPNPI